MTPLLIFTIFNIQIAYSIMKEETQLPIQQHEEQILEGIRNGRTFVISGKTGCGKSTQVPKFILKQTPEAKIAVCEPRRLAAISLAHRVSQQLGKQTGDIVGYQIGMQSKISEKTQVKFMTYGILIQELLFNKDITYTHIILDQVHERSLEMDFTFIALRKILDKKQMKHIKLVIMSATINSQLFCDYFSTHQETNQYINPIIQYSSPRIIEKRGIRNQRGRKFQQKMEVAINPNNKDGVPSKALDLPDKNKYKIIERFANQILQKGNFLQERIKSSIRVPEYYHDDDVRIVEGTYTLAVGIMKKYLNKSGDILIFVPGMQQIKTLKTMIEKDLRIPSSSIIEVHSAYSEDLYSKLFRQTPQKKYIIATNIGESSITLPFCKVVIDFCLNRKNIASKSKGFTKFETRIASRANLLQRAGRVGRTSDGQVFRLISKKQYSNLSDFDVPEIKCVSLETVILKAKQIDKTCNSTLFQDPYDVFLNAIEPPQISQIHEAIQYLLQEEALANIGDKKDGRYIGENLKLTKIGLFMVGMPCSIRISKMIILSIQFDIASTMIGIASILMCQKKFFIPEDKMPNIEEFMHAIIGYDKGEYNDFLLRQKLFSHWKSLYYDKYLQSKGLRYMQKTKVKKQDEEGYERVTEQFCIMRYSKQERQWCNDRGVSPNTLRQILKIHEDLKNRLSQLNINIKRKKQNVENQLVLLCLSMAFQDTTCALSWKPRVLLKKKQQLENVVSLIDYEGITTQDNIYDYIHPQKDVNLQMADGGFIKIRGNCSILSKFLLPMNYTKASLDRTSDLFEYLCSTPPKVSYTYEPALVSQRVKQIFILNTSINKVNIRPNHQQNYMLIAQSIFSSKGRYYIGECALIEEKLLILIKMMTTKNIQIELHVSRQFYDQIKISDDIVNLPFFLSNSDLNLILDIRKFALWEKDRNIGKENNEHFDQESHETKKKVMNLFKNIKVKPMKETWHLIFNEIEFGKHPRPKFMKIQDYVELSDQKSKYFEEYRKWKEKQLKGLYYNFRIHTLKKSVIICAECHKNGAITVIDDLAIFDHKQKVLPLNEYRGSFKIENDRLLCVKGHLIGRTNIKDIAELENQSVLMYGPFQRIQKFSTDQEIIGKFIAKEAEGVSILEKEQREIQEFSCRICADYSEQDGIKLFTLRNLSGDVKEFWRKIEKHMYSPKHCENVDFFLAY